MKFSAGDKEVDKGVRFDLFQQSQSYRQVALRRVMHW
jgi:hypothetical protein